MFPELPALQAVHSIPDSNAAVRRRHLLSVLLHLKASRAWVQNKVDESKHEIHSQVDAITAGTASVVNLTAGE